VGTSVKRLGVVENDAQNRDKGRSLTTGNRPTLPECGNEVVSPLRIAFS